MKSKSAKITSSLLCLSVFLTGSFSAQAQSADAEPPLKGSASVKFAAAQAELDNSPSARAARKLKPFTLGASQLDINGGASDDALKADTHFTTDPFGRPFKGEADSNRFRLQANEAVRLLAKYNVELVVDRSCSMGQRDCPGGLSRWQWCGEQAASLAQAISPLVPQGLTIVPFATEFDVFDNASAQNIQTLFDTMHLQQGTRLYEPLAEQFDTYFANHASNKKPLLVVVITDGVPVPKIEPELVRKELVAASNRQRKPQEVTVIFCQIGEADAKGQAYLEDLDQNLSKYGARYDIVHTITFDNLQQQGLGPALADSLQKFAPPPEADPVKSAQLAKARPVSGLPGHARLVRRGAG